MTTFAEVNRAYQAAHNVRRAKPQTPPPTKTKRAAHTLVAEFAVAHLQLLKQGRVLRPTADHRLTVCTGELASGDRVSEPCPQYRPGKGKKRGDGSCGACGCPTWPFSQMRRKVWYPVAICALKRFSIARGRRATA